MEITLRHRYSPVNLLHISEHLFIRTPLKDCFCMFKLWFFCFYISLILRIMWAFIFFHYLIRRSTTSFSKAWFQVLRRFKSCLRRIVDSRWWGSLAMVLAGNKAKRLSPLNHTTKTINRHHHLHLYPKVTWRSSSFSSVVCSNLTNLLNWIPRVFFNNFSHAVT